MLGRLSLGRLGLKLLRPVFLLPIIILILFFSTRSYAVEDDGTLNEGYHYGGFRTASEYCQNKFLTHQGGVWIFSGIYDYGTYGWCLGKKSAGQANDDWVVQYTRSSCGSSTAEYCQPLPSNDCPAQGDVIRGAEIVNGIVHNGVFIETPINGTITIGGTLVADDGCEYARSTSPDAQPTKCEAFDDSSFICFKDLVATGQTGTASDDQPMVVVPGSDNSINQEGDGSTNTQKDSSETVIEDPTVVTDPDGTKITTEQELQTDIKGDGVKITVEEDKTFISESNGIIKNKITTTTTYENPDGTKTVVTDVRTEYTQTPITNYSIDHSNGTTTVTATGGSSAGTQSTTTENFTPDGSLSDSSTETAFTGDEDVAQEADEGEEEEVDMPDVLTYGDVESWWETDYPEGMGTILDNAKSDIQSNGLVSGFLTSGSFPNSGHIPAFTVPIPDLVNGVLRDEEIVLPDIMVSFMRTAFFILALFAARRIVFGG